MAHTTTAGLLTTSLQIRALFCRNTMVADASVSVLKTATGRWNRRGEVDPVWVRGEVLLQQGGEDVRDSVGGQPGGAAPHPDNQRLELAILLVAAVLQVIRDQTTALTRHGAPDFLASH